MTPMTQTLPTMPPARAGTDPAPARATYAGLDLMPIGGRWREGSTSDVLVDTNPDRYQLLADEGPGEPGAFVLADASYRRGRISGSSAG